LNIYIIEGGIGKNISFTALIEPLYKKLGEKIIVISAYPEVFFNNPFVHRSLTFNTPNVYEDIIQNKENKVINFEPYWDNEFIKGSNHIIDIWAREFELTEYTKEPKIYLTKDQKDFAKEFKKKNGDFILVQFTGGQSPYSYDPKKPFKNNGQVKDYENAKAQEIVDYINVNFPHIKVVDYSLKNEGAGLRGAMGLDLPYSVYGALLAESSGIIGIDSSLQHMAAAVGRSGIVLWGATGPHQFGYEIHNNLSNECLFKTPHCMRPYVRSLGDIKSNGEPWRCPDPKCIEIPVDKIKNEVSKMLSSVPKKIFIPKKYPSYIIGTGWWLDKSGEHSGSEVSGSSKLLRTKDTFKMWLHFIRKYSNPKKIIVCDSDSPIKPDANLLKTNNIELVSSIKNFGHAFNTTDKLCGADVAQLTGMMYALINDVDYFVYIEQDCFIRGGGIVERAVSNLRSNKSYTHGLQAGLKTEQSFMVFSKDMILDFIKEYLSIENSSKEIIPEQKYEMIRLSNKFDFVELPFGYGRVRPIDFSAHHIYAQQWKDDELTELLRLENKNIKDFINE
jgi:hypothetical protein